MSAAEMREALKPCPFCGGEAAIEKSGHARQSMIIACQQCGARVESGDVSGLTAVKDYRWNRRAPLPDEEGMVETVAEEPDILRAAVEEYLLRHPSEGPDERISRAAAVRGMMVRLGLYSEFERAVDYAVFQSPAIRDINGGKP